MGQTIVATFDGSPWAERALPLAAALVGTSGTLVLLGIAAERQGAVHTARRLHRAAEYVRDCAAAPGTEVHVRVALGDPVAAIQATAASDRWGPTAAIVLSAAAAGGAAGRWHGRTVAGVLRAAPAPVLLVPETCACDWPGDGRFRVLAALDGSRPAEDALAAACALLAGRPVHVLLAQSVAPIAAAAARPACRYMQQSTERAADEAARYLEHVAASLAGSGLSAETRVLSGDPATTVAAEAYEAAVHLIALATHGSGAAWGELTGRTAAGIIQASPVPVLLVRPAWARQVTAPGPPTCARRWPHRG